MEMGSISSHFSDITLTSNEGQRIRTSKYLLALKVPLFRDALLQDKECKDIQLAYPTGVVQLFLRALEEPRVLGQSSLDAPGKVSISDLCGFLTMVHAYDVSGLVTAGTLALIRRVALHTDEWIRTGQSQPQASPEDKREDKDQSPTDARSKQY